MLFAAFKARLGGILKNRINQILLGLVIILALLCIVFASICFTSLKTGMTSSRVTRFGLQNIGELATQSGFFTSVQVIENARDVFGFPFPLQPKNMSIATTAL